jgi:hypothetical protein
VKRVAVIAVLSACALGVTSSSSNATTTGGCPAGSGAAWTLVDATDFFGLPADFPTWMVPGMDQNMDGMTCVRQIVRFPIEDRNNYLWRDNTV